MKLHRIVIEDNYNVRLEISRHDSLESRDSFEQSTHFTANFIHLNSAGVTFAT